MTHLEKMTVRARAAYFLSFAEKALAKLGADAAGYQEARSAMALAWAWVAKEDVQGDMLYECLENEDDTGLMVFGGAARNDARLAPAWNVVLTAILYVTWQSYMEAGEEYLPQTIESVDETIVDDLVRHGKDAGVATDVELDAMRLAFQQRFPGEDGSFGDGISKSDALAIGG